MRNLKKILTFLIFLGFTVIGTAQETAPDGFFQKDEPKVRSIRIGAKIGYPNLLGGNLEYVTPLLNKKLSVNVDYSTVKSDWFMPANEQDESEDSENPNFSFNYLEGGLNYYFFRTGSGLYGGISYGLTKVQGTIYNVHSNDENNYDMTGTGTIDFSHNSMNLKLGAKLGGLFYFRPEVGYSFSPIPNSIDMEVVYEDGSREIRTEELYDTAKSPGSLLSQGLIANIGLGFAF